MCTEKRKRNNIFFLWVLLTGAPEALVKQLKEERKNKVNDKNNTFSSFKK